MRRTSSPFSAGCSGASSSSPYLTREGWLKVTLLEHAIRYSDIHLLDDIISRPATCLIDVFILLAPPCWRPTGP